MKHYTSECDIDCMKHFGFVLHSTWLDECINRGSKLRRTEAKSNEYQTRLDSYSDMSICDIPS